MSPKAASWGRAVSGWIVSCFGCFLSGGWLSVVALFGGGVP